MQNQNPHSMMLGVGLDNQDGQKRITKGENFVLVGGSEETHERMTESMRPASSMVMVDRGEIFSKGKMATK